MRGILAITTAYAEQHQPVKSRTSCCPDCSLSPPFVSVSRTEHGQLGIENQPPVSSPAWLPIRGESWQWKERVLLEMPRWPPPGSPSCTSRPSGRMRPPSSAQWSRTGCNSVKAFEKPQRPARVGCGRKMELTRAVWYSCNQSKPWQGGRDHAPDRRE